MRRAFSFADALGVLEAVAARATGEELRHVFALSGREGVALASDGHVLVAGDVGSLAWASLPPAPGPLEAAYNGLPEKRHGEPVALDPRDSDVLVLPSGAETLRVEGASPAEGEVLVNREILEQMLHGLVVDRYVLVDYSGVDTVDLWANGLWVNAGAPDGALVQVFTLGLWASQGAVFA